MAAEVGQEFFRRILQVQTNKCEGTVRDVQNLALEQGLSPEKLDLVGDIRSEVEAMEENTKELFENRDRIGDINRHVRRILINIAKDFGYEQKLYDENNNIRDDISTLFYWFRMVAKSKLGQDFREVTHQYAIHECRRKRNDVEHGESGDHIRPDVVAIGVLTWSALDEILQNWEKSQRPLIHGHWDSLSDMDSDYGFVCKLNEAGGDGAANSITRYSEGEKGNNIAFTPVEVEEFPSVGDVVTFTESERDGRPIATDISIL